MQGMVLVLGPAALAGLVAVAVTVAIERLGGVRGGLLGTLPTTIVPASIGIWAAAPEPAAFAAAMGAVPVGMLVNAGFLWLWRAIPPRLPAMSLPARLTGMLGVTLTLWVGLAWIGVVGLDVARAGGLDPLAVGGVALLLNGVVGALACLRRVPAPTGRNRVGPIVLVARSLLAAAAIAASTLLARSGDDVLAGVASVFPAIFVTTMVGLWVSQDEAVPAGAVGPMMLGASSVGAYALGVALLAPWTGLPLAGVLAWFGAVAGVTVPAWVWLHR